MSNQLADPTRPICSRPNCGLFEEARGLCRKHYRAYLTTHRKVDARVVAAHIAALRAAGLGWSRLEQLTGLSNRHLRRIVDLAKFVYPETAQPILAIPVPAAGVHRPTVVDLLADGAAVPVTGTSRRLQALIAMGYTNEDLAESLGTPRGYLTSVVHARRPFCTNHTAKRVDALFRKLQLQPAPDGYGNRRARMRAARVGWAKPFDWDEEDIDDPAATPNLGEVVRVSFVERYEELVELGYSAPVIAERMGIAAESLERSLYRHGIHPARAAA